MTLDDLLDDYLDAVLERNPHAAILLGVHEYDALPNGTHPRQVSSEPSTLSTANFCVWVPIRNNMSKNISVSDEVYELLKREKGDRSFSEVIEEKVEAGGKIEDVVGTGVLDEETYREVKEDIRELSQGTGERLE